MYFPKCRTLTLKDIDNLCRQLCEMIKVPNIDCVVSVEKGGWYVGDKIARQLDVPHFKVTTRRFDDEELRSLYQMFPEWLKIIPILYQGLLQKIRSPRLIKGLSCVDMIKGKNVLLVDDAIHTGITLEVTKGYLNGLEPMTIHAAVLASVKGSRELVTSILQGHYCYPWSKISSEYRKFQEIHQKGHNNYQ